MTQANLYIGASDFAMIDDDPIPLEEWQEEVDEQAYDRDAELLDLPDYLKRLKGDRS